MSMDTLSATGSWPEGLIPAWQTDNQLYHVTDADLRLRRITEDGPDNISLSTDFDGVFTFVGPDGLRGSMFGVMRRHMTEAGRTEHRRLNGIYLPKEMDGSLTPDESAEWQHAAHECLVGAPLNTIIEDALSSIEVRPGAPELSMACQKLGIPIFYKSAGAANIIEAVMANLGITAAAVYANRLTVDGAGRITGVDPASFVHSWNKADHNHRLHPSAADRFHTILLGDRPHDAKAVTDSTLAIRVDGSLEELTVQDGHEAYARFVGDSALAGYHLISVKPDLLAVSGLISMIGGRTAAAQTS